MPKWIWLLLPLLWCSGKAQAEYFTIALYEIHVNITPEGYADFEEIITVDFSEPRHGIIRFIPYKDELMGKPITRIYENIEVDGFKVSQSKENNNIVLKIGDADKYVDGRQVYTIRYRVLNPLNFFENDIQFYWDLIGVQWKTEIGSVNFQITLPDQVFLADSNVYVNTGAAGMQGKDVRLTVFPREAKGHTTRVFQPGEGVTIAMQFNKDAFKAMDDSTYWLKRHGLLIPPIFFIIIGIIAKWFTRNKTQTIMTEFFPPENVSPAIAGGFVDHSVDNNDVLCLIPHLANKGYLRLEVEKGSWLTKDNIIFYKLKEAGSDLFEFERQFFNGLFSGSSRVELKHLKDKFYTTMSTVKSSVRAWIQQQGWYEKEQRKFGCALGIIGLIAVAWGAYAVFGRQNLDGFALIGSGILLFILTGTMNKRSPAGNKSYQKLEGFRQFVAKAEKPVIERLLKEDPLYYDKTMPYALAFGYLKKWNHQFEGLLTQPPNWYTGPAIYMGDPMRSWSNFSESFPSEINNIGSVFSSSPSSSGSSGGGGGGGFSGGGSGGGGGSSW
jgi:uncharacterized membrane protein